jgi:hypothetical protein
MSSAYVEDVRTLASALAERAAGRRQSIGTPQ